MNKIIVILLACTFVSCSQFVDKPDAKKTAVKKVTEYCLDNSKDGVLYEAGEIVTATVQGNEGYIKVHITKTENGQKTKLMANVGVEMGKGNVWAVKDFGIE